MSFNACRPRATDKPSRFQRRWTWISPSRRRTRGIKWLCLAKASALQARKSKNQSAIKSHVKPITWEIECGMGGFGDPNDLGKSDATLGGYGSGWQSSKKATVEGSLVLTASVLVRKKAL